MKFRNSIRPSGKPNIITSFSGVSVVLLIIFLLAAGCAPVSQAQNPDDVQIPEESEPVTEEQEETAAEEENIQAVEQLIGQLGQRLKNVSLSSPADIIKDQIQQNYGGLVSEQLIQKWIEDPAQALGRQTSSPWPQGIEIEKIEKLDQDCYLVTGQVKEVTSVEVEQGGYSGKYSIELTVCLKEGQWLITESARGPYQSQEPGRDIGAIFDNLEKSTDNINGIFEFIDQNIQFASPELATEMVSTVLRLCEEYEPEMLTSFSQNEIQEAIYKALPSPGKVDMELLESTDNQDLKELVKEAIEKKYRLIAIEGFYEPVIDYQAYQQYGPYLTDEMNSYINLKAKESNNPGLLDAGIPISMDEYVQRIAEAMDYVLSYPQSPRMPEIKEYANLRLRFYLGGIDNSPAFDLNQKIYPRRRQDLEEKLEIYKGTELGDILDSYLKLLQQHDYIKTQQVNDFIDNIGSKWGS